MRTALAELALSIFMIIYIFQPTFDHLYYLKSLFLQQTLDQSIQKAGSAEYGCFTPEIVLDLKTRISQVLRIPVNNISFSGTTTPVLRGEYVDGSVSIPAPKKWIFDDWGGSTSAKTISKYTRIMSEYTGD